MRPARSPEGQPDAERRKQTRTGQGPGGFEKLLGALQVSADSRVALSSMPTVTQLMDRWGDKAWLPTSRFWRSKVDRIRARFAAWYEFFPRSQGKVPGQVLDLQGLRGAPAGYQGDGLDRRLSSADSSGSASPTEKGRTT